MCRSIKRLHNITPPVTGDEIQAAALQFVRKISGSRAPSRANAAAFGAAVEAIAAASRDLLAALETTTPPLDRATLDARARARGQRRAASVSTSAHTSR